MQKVLCADGEIPWRCPVVAKLIQRFPELCGGGGSRIRAQDWTSMVFCWDVTPKKRSGVLWLFLRQLCVVNCDHKQLPPKQSHRTPPVPVFFSNFQQLFSKEAKPFMAHQVKMAALGTRVPLIEDLAVEANPIPFRQLGQCSLKGAKHE